MIATRSLASRRLAALVHLLDIPNSHYQLATDRYHAFGEWLHRPQSKVARYEPAVCAQGSFRYGTVNRPLFKRDEYDLDAVAELLLLTKSDKSQKEVKHLLGDEVKAHATAKNFNSPPDEKPRCWRLDYADAVKFHMDLLPAIPEDAAFKQLLVRHGVDPDHAACAIAITDKRHPSYTAMHTDWPRSNPKGFAKWFEERMRPQAEQQLKAILETRALASIDDVPTWEWKTPLQRAIQILKRHRDVLFKDNCELAPISMILTTLAALAYEGQADLYDTLVGVLDGMPAFVQSTAPRIPNPVNPGEDFADRWKTDDRLEASFWRWHMQAKADISALARSLESAELREYATKKFRIEFDEDEARDLAGGTAPRPSIWTGVAAPAVIKAPLKPWGNR